MITTAPTRDRLVAAAHDVVREGGYAAASVAAVAERAGTGASTLYRHFPSKGQLFVEVFRTVCEGEIRAAEAAAAAHDDPVAQVLAWVRTFCARALAAPRLAWALIAEPVDPLVEAERLAFRRSYRDGIAGRIAAGVAAGRLPAQDPHLSAAALVGALGEALVGPTSPDAVDPDLSAHLQELMAFTRRALGDA
ncbi:TetR/AcrR family transcriptional regulator [Euzebya sp.]|uniref:TetR/AcrR family transcriptional regulator n=1 Tax=Euzebya sp. TaxID=1971409 RepID=UPI003516314D